MRICDPFREAGWWFLVAERHFELRCPCGVTQRADVLRSREHAGAVLYDCAHCGAPLIGIATDDGSAPPDDGHRMCGFVFASRVEMTLLPPGTTGEGELPIPASPRCFSARRWDEPATPGS